MEPSVVLVTLILQIASSRCRNIEFLNDELNIDRDFLPSNIPGHIAFPSPPNDDFYQNLDRFNELKKFLKVIPYKGKGDLKNKTIPGEHEDDKDFPIAVIMASNLDENLSDNLNPADINDYFTKVIENSYKLDKTIDDRRKKGKTHAEHALENDNERLLQHEAKLQFTTNRPTHAEHALENDNERLLQHEAKLQFTTNRPTHSENDNERLLQHEAKLQFSTSRSTIDLNDKVLDQESTELLNEMDLKKTLNEVKKKPNTSSNTQTPTFTNNASSQHSPIHIEDTSSIQHLLPTTEKNINLNKIDAHDDITLQEDDILNMHDLIKSIHDLDKLQFEKYVEENNDTFNKTLGVKSPKHQKIISCKEFNITDHLTDRNYNLKFVFNF